MTGVSLCMTSRARIACWGRGLKCDALSGSGGSVPRSYLRALDDALWVRAGEDGGNQKHYTSRGQGAAQILTLRVNLEPVRLSSGIVCLQWPNIRLISLHACLFTHDPPCFSQLSRFSVYPLGSLSELLVKPRLPAAVNPSLLSSTYSSYLLSS